MTGRTYKVGETNQIRPLTHLKSDGVLYKRTAIVTSQIESAIDLDPSSLVKRARISNTESPDYLQEEGLVYFVREYHRVGNEEIVNELAELLLERCAKRIHRRLKSLGPVVRGEAYRDVVESIFQRILDLESDRADFMEIRFWMTLKNLIIDTYRKYSAWLDKTENVDNFSSLERIPPNSIGEEGAIIEERIPGTGLPVEDNVLLWEALGTLDEPYRTVLLLRWGEGWQIESNDPNTPTISEHFKKTPRTIRTWLATAESQLNEWRDERNKYE